MDKKQFVVLSKETWTVIENLLMELPFKISSQVVKKIQEDAFISIIDSEKYNMLLQNSLKQNQSKEQLENNYDLDNPHKHPNQFEK